MKKMTAVLGLALLLSACSTDETTPPMAAHGLPPKIVLDVQSITLADRSGVQPAGSPYANNHLSPTIGEAIHQWASDRLQANGQTGQAIIIIKDASLIAQPLPIKEGMDGWFTRQQGSKYIGRAELSIEANGREGFATTDAVATRSVTLPEDPTPMEKQDAYYTLLNGLMKDLGQNLESGIQMHMTPFIMSAPVATTAAMDAPLMAPSSMPTALSMGGGLPPAPPADRPVAPMMGNGSVALTPMAPLPVPPAMAPPVQQQAMTPPLGSNTAPMGMNSYPGPAYMPASNAPPATIPLSGSYGQ